MTIPYVEKIITYFMESGKPNMEQTIRLAVLKANELKLKKIVVFTGDGEGALIAKSLTNGQQEIIAATFPFGHRIYDKEGKYYTPGTSKKETVEKLQKEGIKIAQCSLPFDSIIVPGANDSKLEIIHWTLSTISWGLSLCVQGVLMAFDCGLLDQNEDVISLASDTAVVVSACNSRLMFHPKDGLKIKEVICMPTGMPNKK